MHSTTTATFTWREDDPAHPAHSVHVRFVAYDNPEITHPLRQTAPGIWTGKLDLPAGFRSSYQLCPIRDRATPTDDWNAVIANGIPDPANKNTIGPVYGNANQASIVELPDAPPQPFRERRPGIPRGRIRSLPTHREWPTELHIYTPPTPADDGPLPVLAVFDAQAWMNLDVTTIFDNLIADGLVQPFLSILIGYPFGPRRVHGLTHPSVHLAYLLDDLMPWAVTELNATTDPARTVLAGQSLGGLAAVACALAAPHRFGNALSQSGSFWWPSDNAGQLSGAEVIGSVESAKPIRFWLEAGALEHTLLPGNRGLYAALTKHGYAAHYREYQGGHDFACWRAGLPDGLITLMPSADLRKTGR